MPTPGVPPRPALPPWLEDVLSVAETHAQYVSTGMGVVRVQAKYLEIREVVTVKCPAITDSVLRDVVVDLAMYSDSLGVEAFNRRGK